MIPILYKDLIIIIEPLKNMSSEVLIAIITGVGATFITAIATIVTIIFSNKSSSKQLKKQITANKEDLEKQIAANKEDTDRKFKLNKDWQDSKRFTPIILRLSQNLFNLHSAFLFKGSFCPSLEAQCPNLNEKDLIAKRGYQFLQIGLEIINDTKQILYLIPSKKLPKLTSKCSDILKYLEKKEEGKKRHLDFLIVSIIGNLVKSSTESRKMLDDASKQFYEFYVILDEIMKEEFPSLNS